MCIRDRVAAVKRHIYEGDIYQANLTRMVSRAGDFDAAGLCLLYTSDAADERSSVDLGGRRIIKKKKSDADGCHATNALNNEYNTI